MTDTPRAYEAYGECLSSRVAFPELRESAATETRWSFAQVERLEPMRDARELGDDHIYGEVHARLFAHGTGHRILVDDTGEFDIADDGHHMRCSPRPDAWPDFVRAHLLGRVLSTAMFLDGRLPLHGSAVAVDGGVIAFLAPKGFGKSSLALALTAAGARLVSDDTLPVVDGPEPIAWPGVHSVRVHDDVIETVGMDRPTLDTREGKRIVTGLDSHQLQREPAPLRAIYLLAPVEGDVDAVARTELSATISAISIVAHVKIGRMLGPDFAATMLTRAASIARCVPVFQLRVQRELDRLPAAATTLLGWHGVRT